MATKKEIRALTGKVAYDNYILEPLSDGVYMRRIPDERFNN